MMIIMVMKSRHGRERRFQFLSCSWKPEILRLFFLQTGSDCTTGLVLCLDDVTRREGRSCSGCCFCCCCCASSVYWELIELRLESALSGSSSTCNPITASFCAVNILQLLELRAGKLFTQVKQKVRIEPDYKDFFFSFSDELMNEREVLQYRDIILLQYEAIHSELIVSSSVDVDTLRSRRIPWFISSLDDCQLWVDSMIFCWCWCFSWVPPPPWFLGAAPLLEEELLATNVENTFPRLTSFYSVSDLHWTLMLKQIMMGVS